MAELEVQRVGIGKKRMMTWLLPIIVIALAGISTAGAVWSVCKVYALTEAWHERMEINEDKIKAMKTEELKEVTEKLKQRLIDAAEAAVPRGRERLMKYTEELNKREQELVANGRYWYKPWTWFRS